MLKNFIDRIKNTHFVHDYSLMWPYVRPYWGRALFAVLITIPIGALDAVIAWALKPYMDVMMIEKSANTYWIPLMIIAFSEGCREEGTFKAGLHHCRDDKWKYRNQKKSQGFILLR